MKEFSNGGKAFIGIFTAMGNGHYEYLKMYIIPEVYDNARRLR